MKKWGIQFIGVLFLLWASLNLFGLITGISSTKGFLGISFVITYNNKSIIDIMAWIGVYVLGYTGYHLLKLDMQGRTWALIVLWPSVIFTGLFLLLTIVSLISSSYFHFDNGLGIILHFFNFKWPVEGLHVLWVSCAFFILNFMPVYFLMRKDIKALFLKTDEVKEKVA